MQRGTRSSLVLTVLAAGVGPVAAADDIYDITWKLGPNLPEFRKGGCATTLGGKVISVFGMRQPWGEMATMYVYDPATDWWSRGPDGPIGQTYVQGAESGRAFYAIGGRSAPLGGVHPRCFRLEETAGRYVWTRLADLNDARGWAPSVSVDGTLYVFGGAKGGHGPTLRSVEALDTTKPDAAWKKVADIPGASRGWLGAAAVDGQIYVLGGSHFFPPKPAQGPDRKRFDEVWRFDPSTRQWQARRAMPFALAGFDSCVYQDRYIIVVGGAPTVDDFTAEMKRLHAKDPFAKSYYSPFVLVYDTRTDTWRRLPSRLPMPTNDVRVVILDDTLYVLGGENVEPATSNTTPWLHIGRIEAATGREVILRETVDALLLPGRFSTLSSTRDNLHELVAGPEGARVLDIFTYLRKPAGSRYLDFVGEAPVDVARRLYRARWHR